MSCGYGCSGCGRCEGLVESKIIPRGKCPVCQTQNSPSAKECKKCGAPLDPTRAVLVRPGTR